MIGREHDGDSGERVMTVGQLAAGAGIGVVGGGLLYASLRGPSEENAAVGATALLLGAGAVTWGAFMPTAMAKVGLMAIGGGMLLAGGLGLRDAMRGAVDDLHGYPQAA